MAPLIAGHGIQFGFGCETEGVCLEKGQNPSLMPESKDGYMQWLDWSLKMLAEEASLIPRSAKTSDFFVGALGLSLGASLATDAASKSPLIQKALIANPFYAFTNVPFDFQVQSCQSDPNPEECLFREAPLADILEGTNAIVQSKPEKEMVDSAPNLFLRQLYQNILFTKYVKSSAIRHGFNWQRGVKSTSKIHASFYLS